MIDHGDDDDNFVASFDESDDFGGPSASTSRPRCPLPRRPAWDTFDRSGRGRPRSPAEFPTVDKDIQYMKRLIEEATARSKVRELGPLDTPDIRYVLRYKSRRNIDVDLLQSAEPFDLDLDGVNGTPGGRDEAGAADPAIEIITHVHTNLIFDRYGVSLPSPSPPPRRGYFPRRQRDLSCSSRSPSRERRRGGIPPPPPRYPPPQIKALKLLIPSIVIKSPHLASAIRAVVEYYPGIGLHAPNLTFTAPYEVLYHHRAALVHYKTNQPDTHEPEYALTTAKHIDVLLAFLDKTWGQQVRDEEELHNKPVPIATHNNLWMLFKPGEIVFSKYCGKWAAFVVSHSSQFVVPGVDRPVEPHLLNVWRLTYNGDEFERTIHELQIEPFSGEQAISNLAVIPSRFFRGADGNQEPAVVLAEYLRLGKLTWELTKSPSYMSYEGSLASHEVDDDEWSHPTNTTGFMSGRVMVDCSGIASPEHRPDSPIRVRRERRAPSPQVGRRRGVRDTLPYFAAKCDCPACSKVERGVRLSALSGFDDLRPKVDEMPQNDTYFIVILKIVGGFILGERRWAWLNVDQLREVEFDREAFKHLVLDDEIKLTVKALIGKFASDQGLVSPWPNDFVRNKGQGRIFLLHGSPGVGKTCTAEATAELARRPLISLTAGDLGRHGVGVERKLDHFLKLGERYGAIVLLDEADVYLERRRTSDIARNGLVSVFLRALEYYRGVLFLTTNRVEMFDAAFTSRIHVALHYGPLTDEHREKIWLNSFERLERDSSGRLHISVATRQYAYESRDVQSLEWNGREIRNALQTAVALAETEALGDDLSGTNIGTGRSDDVRDSKIIVTDKHLRAVVKMSRGFKMFSCEKHAQDGGHVEEEDNDCGRVIVDESDGSSLMDD